MENPSTWTKRGAERSADKICEIGQYIAFLFALVPGTVGTESGYFQHFEIMRLFMCMLPGCYPIERKQLAQEKERFSWPLNATHSLCVMLLFDAICVSS